MLDGIELSLRGRLAALGKVSIDLNALCDQTMDMLGPYHFRVTAKQLFQALFEHGEMRGVEDSQGLELLCRDAHQLAAVHLVVNKNILVFLHLDLIIHQYMTYT